MNYGSSCQGSFCHVVDIIICTVAGMVYASCRTSVEGQPKGQQISQYCKSGDELLSAWQINGSGEEGAFASLHKVKIIMDDRPDGQLGAQGDLRLYTISTLF